VPPPLDAATGDGPAAQISDPKSGGDKLADLVARKPAAERWLLETEGRRVERVLMRILGDVRVLEDLTQEVFVRVFRRVGEVRDPNALRGFVTSVAVFVAREAIRKKRRHRWLAFLAPDEIPEPTASDDLEAREALRAIYRVLDQLDADDRVAFALRFIDGMELRDVALACGCSLATIKRRLDRAGGRFSNLCRKDEVLVRWIEEGDRWA